MKHEQDECLAKPVGFREWKGQQDIGTLLPFMPAKSGRCRGHPKSLTIRIITGGATEGTAIFETAYVSYASAAEC